MNNYPIDRARDQFLSVFDDQTDSAAIEKYFTNFAIAARLAK